ncbi:Putative racemase YgeA [Seminavis robusta]|uniref:Racemase YgeA n=1 Tax=Seminavis robusta TaxID=568900 RepID=A0A9N8HCI0_9STRA|nr:Putative racemase YgeA [Seminavis robusta]|eukprot:Sro302_g112300.1 Putative racemase YgeA (240) ;mRNA; r:67340-68059
MKTIGLLGGMSWESTQLYYAALNRGVQEKLGGLHSAEIVLYSVDFDPIAKLQHDGDWAALAERLAKAAQGIESAGAQGLVICTNTMHKLAPQIQAAISIPLLHIADATAEVLQKKALKSVLLLGTKFTMEDSFYKGRLMDKYGIQVLVPDQQDRDQVHRVIYEELCKGEVKEESEVIFLGIIGKMTNASSGRESDRAQGVILGCTEIAMLVKPERVPNEIPVFDTTEIHAQRALDWALD